MEQSQIDPNIWTAVQERVGYTDEQLEIFKQHAFPHKILQNKVIENLLLTAVIFEVVESNNCNIQHKVGDKFYFNAEGYMITNKCPDKICPFIMPYFSRMMWLIMDRIYEGRDPLPTFPFGHCDDVGVECGGMGKIRVQIKIVRDDI